MQEKRENEEDILTFEQIKARRDALYDRYAFYVDEGLENFAYAQFIKWYETSSFIDKRQKYIVDGIKVHALMEGDQAKQEAIRRVLSVYIRRIENKLMTHLAIIQGSLTHKLTVEKGILIAQEQLAIKELRAKGYSKQTTGAVQQYFRDQERRRPPDIKRWIKHSQQFADATHVMSSTQNAILKLEKAVHAVFHTAKGLEDVLKIIPIVSVVALVIPMVLNTIRTIASGKNTTRNRLGAVATLGIVIGAIIAAGLVAVATAGIVAGLIGLGMYVHGIKPLRETQKKLALYKEKIKRNNARLKTLSNSSVVENLTRSEKHALLIRLEKYAKNAKPKSEEAHEHKQAIASFKQAILKNNVHQLSESAILTNVIGNRTLHKFLRHHAERRATYLTRRENGFQKIVTFRKKLLATTVLCLIGAILLCVPTPITIAVGAGLFAIGTVAGIAVKYQWGSKIAAFFKRKFGGGSAAANVDEENKNEKSLRDDLALEEEHSSESETTLFKQFGGPDAAKEATHIESETESETAAEQTSPESKVSPPTSPAMTKPGNRSR